MYTFSTYRNKFTKISLPTFKKICRISLNETEKEILPDVPVAENMRDERTVVASSIIHKSIEEAIEVPLQMNTVKGTTFLIFLERCDFVIFAVRVCLQVCKVLNDF
jgi:hypothetical protein